MMYNVESIFALLILLVQQIAAQTSSTNATEEKDVCYNSCRLLMSYSDYETCHCSPMNGNEPCVFGCQLVRCLCPRMPVKVCQIWCSGYDVWHGCDCSRTWSLDPLPEPTTKSPVKVATTTTSLGRLRGPRTYPRSLHEVTDPPTSYDHGASPIAIGSIVAVLVVVLAVVAILIAYAQRRLVCQKLQLRQRGHRSTFALALIDPVRADGSTSQRGFSGHYLRNQTYVCPAPTPILPPSYAETIRQTNIAESRAPEYIESPPPYSSICKVPEESRNVPETEI